MRGDHAEMVIMQKWFTHLWVRLDVQSGLPLAFQDGLLRLALLHVEQEVRVLPLCLGHLRSHFLLSHCNLVCYGKDIINRHTHTHARLALH